MTVPPDYDLDPEGWRSWESPQDVHEMVAPELRGPILDVGCGEGRLASLLGDAVTWVWVDSSPAQLADNPYPNEDAVAIVGSAFDDPEPQRWDARFFPLETRDEVRAYCRHNYVPADRAETAAVPLWLTKRGVLVRATKNAAPARER